MLAHQVLRTAVSGRALTRYHVIISSNRWVKYGPWLAAPRDPDNFVGPRILVQEIVGGKDKRIIAAYQVDELYHSRDVIPIKVDTDEPHPFFLLAIINSRLMTWYHHKRNPKAMKGLFPKVLVSDLRKMPIPKVEKFDSTQKADYARMIELVERMNDLHGRLHVAKIQNEETMLQRQISATDRKIDALIYKLYGLTEDEIRLVEEGTTA